MAGRGVAAQAVAPRPVIVRIGLLGGDFTMMRKRFAFLGVLALVLVLVFPSRANAIDFMPKGVFYQGDVGNGNYGAVVAAYNQYDAACYVLGKNPDSISANIKQKLSDPNYGGRFYEYAQSFFTQSGALEDVPAWVPTYIVWGSELMDWVLTDYQSVWYSTATKTLHDDALVDLVRILNGEDLGGGGSVTPPAGSSVVFSGNYYSVNLSAWDNTRTSSFPWPYIATYATFEDGVLTVGSGTKSCNAYIHSPDYVKNGVLFFSPEVASFVNDKISSGYDVFFQPGAVVVGTDFELLYGTAPGQSDNLWYYLTPHGYTIYSLTKYGDSYYYDGRLFSLALSVDSSGTFSNGTNLNSTYFSNVIDTPFDVSVPPSGTWPEPDPTPTPDPPEVPTPTAPTDVPDPEPTAPTVVWPTAPIVVNPPEVTVEVTPSGLDYTELLTRINDNLNSLNSYTQAINSSLNSLRSDVVSGFDSIVSAVRNVYQYLTHLNDVLEVHCKHIRDSIDQNVYELELYLKQLFEWLPQQLSFDAEFNYDDSGVIAWLKNIYYKLGGGTSAPNPVTDPSGFFEWLLGLITGFLASLLAGLPGKVQDLLSDLTDLTEYFPFSAPWDLYGLLLLFAHDPVIPVFTIPWAFGSGRSADIVIDCTQWDGVMSVVRSVEKIIFAGGLAKLTFDMFRPTDVTGD